MCRVRLTLLAAAVCLGACTGSLFQSKALPPAVYWLSPAPVPPASVDPGRPPAPIIPADLAILKVRPRSGLETDRIAVLYPDRRLDYFAEARWSGALGDVLQDLGVQEFRSRAALRNVTGDASVFASEYWLEMEVTDFQAEYTPASAAPTVHVHILARIGTSRGRQMVAQFAADAEQPASDNRLTAIVGAFARAADAAFAEIIDRTGEILAKNSEAR